MLDVASLKGKKNGYPTAGNQTALQQKVITRRKSWGQILLNAGEISLPSFDDRNRSKICYDFTIKKREGMEGIANVIVGHSLVSIRADSSSFVVFAAIVVGAVIEASVPFSHRPTTSLVHEMPVETCERPMLSALVLEEEGTLLDSEFLQIPGNKTQNLGDGALHWRIATSRTAQKSIYSRVMVGFFGLWSCQQRFGLRRHFVKLHSPKGCCAFGLAIGVCDGRQILE